MNRGIRNGFFAGIGMLLLILDSRTAIKAATEGIELCLHSVIPSIFPFLVLSGVFTAALSQSKLRLFAPLGRLLGVPPAGVGIFLTGILGGYPIGAQAVQRAWKCGVLDTAQAERMLSFCSNAGPAFVFGILSTQFEHQWMLWLLWLIHICAAFLVSAVLHAGIINNNTVLNPTSMSWLQSLRHSVATMGYICGWILLFRIILAFLQRWFMWLLPSEAQVAIFGFLELANGCLQLSQIDSVSLRFVLCSGMLAFGGICVMMQTASVISGLRLKPYVVGKLLQALFSICLSSFTLGIFFPEHRNIAAILFLIPVILTVTGSLFFRKRQNNSSIPAQIGV